MVSQSLLNNTNVQVTSALGGMQVLDSLIDGPLRLRNRREGDELIGMIVRYLRTGEQPEPRTDAQEAVLFAVQLYMDFSGCCDIALGAARILGYDLIENFQSPCPSCRSTIKSLRNCTGQANREANRQAKAEAKRRAKRQATMQANPRANGQAKRKRKRS